MTRERSAAECESAGVGYVRHLVLEHGREAAKELLSREGLSKLRPLADISAEVLGDESNRMGFSYTGFCLTALPHKRLDTEEVWKKQGYQVTLLVEPGRTMVEGEVVQVGVPYGARARMILLYLQTQAIRTGSREIELGRSMRGWMKGMGLSVGGETTHALRDQITRLSACKLSFFWETDNHEGWARGGVLTSGVRLKAPDEGGTAPWDDKVFLDEVFWAALRDHSVPLRETALRQLCDRSMSLDIYIWLAYRCHMLRKATPINWFSLHFQFGSGFKHFKHFKEAYITALTASLAAYPEAKVDISEGGIILHPSRPPISKLN